MEDKRVDVKKIYSDEIMSYKGLLKKYPNGIAGTMSNVFTKEIYMHFEFFNEMSQFFNRLGNRK